MNGQLPDWKVHGCAHAGGSLDSSTKLEVFLRSQGLAPRVSIGLPVYNGGSFLRQALDSVLAQTFKDFELIICDNASNDNTEQICRAYAARDDRIRYYKNHRNLGASWNFNRAFALARGEYFKWIAADDTISSEFLARCVGLLDRDPTTVLAFSEVAVIDEFSKAIRNNVFRQDHRALGSASRRERFGHVLTVMPSLRYAVFGLIRSKVLRRTRLIAPCVGSDDFLLVELALHGKFAELPGRMLQARWHGQSYGCRLGRILRSGGGEGRAQAEWFAPGRNARLMLPCWRRLWEHFKSLVRSRSGLAEKLVMMTFLARTANWRRKVLLKELRDAARRSVGGFEPTAAGRRARAPRRHAGAAATARTLAGKITGRWRHSGGRKQPPGGDGCSRQGPLTEPKDNAP